MERYEDLGEDRQRNVVEELSGVAYRAGYGQALIEAEEARRFAADEAGNRIVRAAHALDAPRSVVSDGMWEDSDGLFSDDQGWDDESGDEYEDGRW